MKFKKLLIGVLVLVVLTIVALVGSVVWWRVNTKAPSTDSDKINFLIPKGKSATQVGESLYKAGLIKSPLAFKLYVQLTNRSKKINTGEFDLSANMNLFEIVDRLGKGPVEIWVTIPEGLRREEVVEKVMAQLGVNDELFRNNFMSESAGLEGYLFPDTYLLPREVSAAKVVAEMNKNFEKKYSEIANSKLTRTKAQIVTLASIVERETKTDGERPVVAGILWKRLDTPGWLIQADASVQYVIGSQNCKNIAGKCNWWPVLTKEELDVNSPYNTYKNKELPPTPIANPGLSSLKAAMYPQDSGFWFYIHDIDGSIHYATNIAEHNANIAKYLK